MFIIIPIDYFLMSVKNSFYFAVIFLTNIITNLMLLLSLNFYSPKLENKSVLSIKDFFFYKYNFYYQIMFEYNYSFNFKTLLNLFFIMDLFFFFH